MKINDPESGKQGADVSTDDVAALFRQFGGEAKSYVDIQDREAALRARERWLLLHESGEEPDA